MSLKPGTGIPRPRTAHQYTGKHFPKHPGTRPPHARLDRMKTRLRAKILLQIELSWNLV